DKVTVGGKGKKMRRIDPGAAAFGAVLPLFVKPFFDELPYVAAQVVEAEFVRREAHHGRGGGETVIVISRGLPVWTRGGNPRSPTALVMVVARAGGRRPGHPPGIDASDFVAEALGRVAGQTLFHFA